MKYRNPLSRALIFLEGINISVEILENSWKLVEALGNILKFNLWKYLKKFRNAQKPQDFLVEILS